MRIYMAGPLFSAAEIRFNSDLATVLRKLGHQIFLPQEHEQRADRPDAIFRSDRDGIDWAEVVLANLDGPDPDSGTCWELGYGFAMGKWCVVYRSDFRLFAGSDPINLMMTESAHGLVIVSPKTPVSLIASALDDEIRLAAAMGQNKTPGLWKNRTCLHGGDFGTYAGEGRKGS